MAKKEQGGLSFQEAFDEAEAEEAVAAAALDSPANGSATAIIPPEREQPAVETEEEVGLFSDIPSEEAESEQLETDSHEVTVNGETFQVTLDELVNGYQRQADYTRGTQEIADMKKEYGKAITLWEALEGDYVGTVQTLMSRTGMKGQVAPKPEVDLEALLDEKLAEKLANDPRLQQLENENSLRQLDVMFGEVEREFDLPSLTDADKQVILTKAQEWGSTDLNYVVYRLLQQQDKAKAVQKNVELVSSSKGRRSADEDDFEAEPKTYATVAEAWEASLAEEGNL